MNKAISFAIVHFSIAMTIGYIMTGSIWVGGAIALIEPAVNTVAFYFHEKVWERMRDRDHSNNNDSIPGGVTA